MATDCLFLAARHPTIPAARRVFTLVGPDAASPADLRGHLLRSWTLRLKMFETKDAADLWAAEGADAGALPSSLSSPTPSPHSFEEGSLLRTVSAAGEAMYDLADCSSASSFFVAIGTATYSAGVRAQGVALTPGGIPDQPRDVRKRRRLEAAAHGAQAATHACATVNLPATAPAGLRAFPPMSGQRHIGHTLQKRVSNSPLASSRGG